MGMPGGSGVCTKCTPEACEPVQLNADPSVTTEMGEVQEAHAATTAGEGEECNPSLPPTSAILCGEGFYCSSSMLGGSGVCTKCTPEACEPVQLNADPSATTE